MKRIYDRVCGIDVHRDTVNACVRLPEHGEQDDGLVAKFGTTTEDLLALRDWLNSLAVTHVAMESTGEYWRPVYYLLEDGFTVLLVNAQHVKCVARFVASDPGKCRTFASTRGRPASPSPHGARKPWNEGFARVKPAR